MLYGWAFFKFLAFVKDSLNTKASIFLIILALDRDYDLGLISNNHFTSIPKWGIFFLKVLGGENILNNLKLVEGLEIRFPLGGHVPLNYFQFYQPKKAS